MDPSLDPALEPSLTKEHRRLFVVARRELEVDCARCASLQQLDLNLADAAADLEHGRVLDASRLEKRDHVPGGLVEAALAVSLGQPPRESRAEEPVATARVAAACHVESLASWRSPFTAWRRRRTCRS